MSEAAKPTADAAAYEDWQEPDLYETPMEIAWQFKYFMSQEKLENLYSKAKESQWNADHQLDWSIEIDPSKPLIDSQLSGVMGLSIIKRLSQSQRDEFSAHFAAQLLSQFLHGEQGALMTSAAVTHAVPDYDAKLYAATQTMDEARHVEVYDRYIKKLAIAYPISPWLKELIDATLSSGHYIKIMIGMNMVVEGLALAAFHNMRRQTTCPLLRDLTTYVLQDESRHVAFGNVYLQKAIKDLHPDDLEDVAQFTFEAVKGMSDSQGGPDGTKPRKADPADTVRSSTKKLDFGGSSGGGGGGGASGGKATGSLPSMGGNGKARGNFGVGMSPTSRITALAEFSESLSAFENSPSQTGRPDRFAYASGGATTAARAAAQKKQQAIILHLATAIPSVGRTMTQKMLLQVARKRRSKRHPSNQFFLLDQINK